MKVKLHNKVLKYLGRMNVPHKNAIVTAIDKLSREPPEGDIKKLQGRKGYRSKVGDFRILFQIREDEVFITNIVPRGQAYNKKEKRK
jgi:mRNA interferase RelE/StbE